MKTNKLFAILLCVACSIGLYSCSDDDAKQPLANPAVNTSGTSYQSLTFSWDAIPNAVQYGYRLTEEGDGYSESGVTKATKIKFNNLQPATTYQLEVWAFAALDGDYSTPPAVVLTATTDALTKLGTPQLTVEEIRGIVHASWDPVENAQSYYYEVSGSGNQTVASGTTTETTVDIRGLVRGDYKFSVYATTAQGGFEQSDAAIGTFQITTSEIWRVTGTYYSVALDSSWNATLIAYSNSTYSILSFYGVEGYNLDFSIDESNTGDMFSFVNGELYEQGRWKYWLIDTGVEYPDKLWTSPWRNACKFEGNATAGEVQIGLYYGDDQDWGYDTFTWDTTKLDIASLPGTYTTHIFGDQLDDNWADFEAYDYEGYDSTIIFEGDDMISLDNFFWDDCPIFGEVNSSERTIVFEGMQVMSEISTGGKYIFGSKANLEESVTAKVLEDGSITMTDFAIWYVYKSGTKKLYAYGTMELIKNSASKASTFRAVKQKPAKPKK